MKHLSESELALASRADLPVLGQLRAKAHALVCNECRQKMEAYRTASASVPAAVDAFVLPRAMNWKELEGEMFANIRLGMDISEVHKDFGQQTEDSLDHPARFSWRAAAAVATIAITIATGWFLAGPGSPRFAPSAVAQVNSGALVLRGDQNGIGLENRGVGMILRNVSSPSARFEVSLEGSVRSSTVDEDSGQVTVSQVYVE